MKIYLTILGFDMFITINMGKDENLVFNCFGHESNFFQRFNSILNRFLHILNINYNPRI